jgi:mannose-6-phosphate isomerase-like protein (cupin superfamily)
MQTFEASVSKFDIADEYYFAEGCFITELSNSSADPELSIARARLEPGKTTRWHSLADTTERYVIIQGVGRVQLGESVSTEVSVGDVVIIPQGVPQRISNSGNVDLVFLAICVPRFQPAAYTDLESR